MLPDNELSTTPVTASYIPPDNKLFNKLIEDEELGGIALQDPSKGLEYRPWRGKWSDADNTVYLQPSPLDVPPNPLIPIFTELNVFEFSFTFDQNMRWCAGTLLNDGTFKLRWYDSQVAGYVITEFSGILAFKLSLDDKRFETIQDGSSDVLFTYIREDKLCVRNQRDRFSIEHVLTTELPPNLLITNFGMNRKYRMQWRMRYRKPGELLPWLL